VTDAVSMIVRMLFSLAVVLAVIAAIYWVAKRRMMPGGRVVGTRRIGIGTGSAARTVRAPLQVLGRVSCSRSTSITAIQFGEQVLLVSSNDQSVATLLASMTREQWESQADRRNANDPADVTSAMPRSVVDSLREITVRHA
jgi:flagellar biogenesis protein FliO